MSYDPPKHLSEPTRKWMREVIRGFELDSHHWRLLCLAGEAWDRAQMAREAITLHGITYTDEKGLPRKRPEVSVENDSCIRFARLVREIGLDAAGTPESPRPNTLRANRRGR